MSRDEVIRAFSMRADGRTWPEIGEELHYTPQGVIAAVQTVLRGRKRGFPASQDYPALAEYITRRYDGYVKPFARDCGVSDTTVWKILRGNQRPAPETLKKIRAVAGNVV